MRRASDRFFLAMVMGGRLHLTVFRIGDRAPTPALVAGGSSGPGSQHNRGSVGEDHRRTQCSNEGADGGRPNSNRLDSREAEAWRLWEEGGALTGGLHLL